MKPSELTLALALLLVGTLAQTNVVVEETSSALSYKPPFQYWGKFGVANGQPADSHYHGGGYVSTSSLGASVSLTFNGSYVAFYSDGYPAHGTMEVELDGRKTNVTQYSPDVEDQKMFFQSYVDPDIPNHILKLTCIESKTMGVDYFVYTAATPKTVGSASLTIQSASRSDTKTSPHPALPLFTGDTTPIDTSTSGDNGTDETSDPSALFTNKDLATETDASIPTSNPNIIISSSSSSKTNVIVVVVSVFSGLLTLLCAPLYFILRRLRRRRRLRALAAATTPYVTEVHSVSYPLAEEAARVSLSSTAANLRPTKLEHLGMTNSLNTSSHGQPGTSRDYYSRLSQENTTLDAVQPPPYV